MRPRAARTAIAAAGLIAAAMVGLAVWITQGTAAAEPDAEAPATLDTAAVEVRTLQVTEQLSGTLGYGEERAIGSTAPGTLTAAPEAGTLVARGDILFEVNGEPTALLIGEMPAWRHLAEGVSGPDVEQLEQNLVELGHGAELEVDEDWETTTTAAVKAWQEAAGMVVDGRVDLGEIVFEPDAVIVAAVEASRGASVGPGTPVLRVTGTDRVVTSSLPADRRDGVDVDDQVEVELGDGSVVTAKVTHIDTAPTTAQDGSQSYVLRLKLGEDAADATDGPVSLRLVRQTRDDVMAVPVNALLALLEGGYAVERVNADGGTELVAVEVGLFADGWVEVRGDLAAGDEVVVP